MRCAAKRRFAQVGVGGKRGVAARGTRRNGRERRGQTRMRTARLRSFAAAVSQTGEEMSAFAVDARRQWRALGDASHPMSCSSSHARSPAAVERPAKRGVCRCGCRLLGVASLEACRRDDIPARQALERNTPVRPQQKVGGEAVPFRTLMAARCLVTRSSYLEGR